jgi:regulator of cell morphogenesis and NO signaling
MSSNNSCYEPPLDQCEALPYCASETLFDDCCQVVQTVGYFLPAESMNKDYRLVSVQELVDVLSAHHTELNFALDQLEALFQSVLTNHKTKHPELERANVLFTILRDELRPHMLKEERVLFPFVIRLDKTVEIGLRSLLSPFVGLQNPLRVMKIEHEAASDLMKDLRNATNNVAGSLTTCAGFRLLCDALKVFEVKMDKHVELEHGILYPRAIEMESRIAFNG